MKRETVVGMDPLSQLLFTPVIPKSEPPPVKQIIEQDLPGIKETVPISVPHVEELAKVVISRIQTPVTDNHHSRSIINGYFHDSGEFKEDEISVSTTYELMLYRISRTYHAMVN